MPPERQVSVELRPDGRWACRWMGRSAPTRCMTKNRRRIARARELAENKRAELVIKDERGRKLDAKPPT